MLDELEIHENAPSEIEKYDMCLVMPTDNDKNELYETDAKLIRRIIILLGRKYIYLFFSSNGLFIFVLIRAGLKLLKNEAEKNQWQFLLDQSYIQELAETGNELHLVDPIHIPYHPE